MIEDLIRELKTKVEERKSQSIEKNISEKAAKAAFFLSEAKHNYVYYGGYSYQNMIGKVMLKSGDLEIDYSYDDKMSMPQQLKNSLDAGAKDIYEYIKKANENSCQQYHEFLESLFKENAFPLQVNIKYKGKEVYSASCAHQYASNHHTNHSGAHIMQINCYAPGEWESLLEELHKEALKKFESLKAECIKGVKRPYLEKWGIE
jgi:hypothetical protein